MRKLLSVAVAGIAVGAMGDVFPDADASHDISSATAWGGEIPAAAEFDSPATTYGASGDVTFGKVKVMEGTNAFDFSATPGRTVTITNSGGQAFWLAGSNSSLELKGGKWFMANGGTFSVGDPGGGGYGTNSVLTLSGGCVVTNAGGLSVGSYGNVDSKFVIRDGSFFHLANNGHITYLSTTRSGASMEVVDGGGFYCGGLFWIDGGGSADPAIDSDVSLLVSGAGSTFGIKNGIYQGSAGHDSSRVTFTDHAVGNIGGLVSLGYSNPSGGHLFTVEKGATLNCGSVAIGHGTKAHAKTNRVEILGATLNVAADLNVGNASTSRMNELFVSNATVVCQKFIVGGGSESTGNRAVFYGPDTHLELSINDSFNLFGNTSSGNEIIFDGVTFEHKTSKNGIYFSLGSNTGNLVRVTNGGSIKTDKAFHIGYNNDFSNRVEVLNGGKLEADGAVVELKRHGQTLVVSNGTLICKNLNIGGYNDKTGSGCRFLLMGERATFTETGRSGTYPIFYCGRDGEVLVSDGAVWSYDLNGVYTSIGSGLTNNTVRVVRGGHFNVANGLFIGYNGDQNSGFSVEDGGFVDCKSLTIGADSQWLAISNGTVTVTNTCSVGAAQGGCTNRKCRIEFSGRFPSMTAGSNMTMDRTAELRFNVPEDGYANTPLTIGGKLNINASCRILVDAEAFREKIARKAKVTLVSFAGANEISATALEESNALLGEGLALTVEDKKIVLNATRDYGSKMIVR
ncbi:MAG: hypothetical protein K6F50_02865 [Kiritimatiellae bacterium]|nr:hypothetical protein [Kiritimatiellia bacterium]